MLAGLFSFFLLLAIHCSLLIVFRWLATQTDNTTRGGGK